MPIPIFIRFAVFVKSHSVLCLLSLFALLCTSGFAQASHTTTVNGLNVTLSLDKTKLAVGEPMVFTIRLENVSSEQILDFGASLQFPEGNGVNLEIQPPDELVYRYAGALEPGVYPITPVQLVKGRPVQAELLVLYDKTQTSGYAFSKPGTYQLTAEVSFNLRKGTTVFTAALPTVEVQVTPAEGLEAEVQKEVDSTGLVRAMHLGVIPTTGILTSLQTLADKYARQSQLGALALRAVGVHYVHREPATREKGAQMLTTYLSNGLVPLDGDWIAWTIAGGYHLSGKYDLARQWIAYLLRTYPNSIRIRPEDALFSFYYFAPAEFASQVPWYMFPRPYVIPNAKPPADLKPLQDKK